MHYSTADPYNSFFRQCPYHNTTSEKNTLTLLGMGTIKAKPDIAFVNLGVITENKDAKTAQQENAVKTTKLINSLKQIGIPENDIETYSYFLDPQYDYIDGKQVFRGYKVSNVLKITIRKLTNIGEIIDTATENGANEVSNVTFSVSKATAYYNEALTLAIKDASIKANTISKTLGVSVNLIPSSITEESYGTPVPLERSAKLVSSSTTPILSHDIEITAKIQAIFNY